jgi:predicted DNA-binding protein (UPF0251 family)/DNA-directed RNA polymerase subunit RPC12/RpoP
MARPVKWRKIENVPAIAYFVPSEKGIAEVPENILKLEELEAIRLKDLEGLEQSECAEKMEVSRPTFQRILLSAREKIADSLVNGKAIHIEGGNFTQNICPVRCMDCGKEWLESFENIGAINGGGYACPACGSKKIVCGNSCQGRYGRGNCWRNSGPGRG